MTRSLLGFSLKIWELNNSIYSKELKQYPFLAEMTLGFWEQTIQAGKRIESDFFNYLCIADMHFAHVLVDRFKTWMTNVQKSMHDVCFVSIMGRINETELVTKGSLQMLYRFVLHLQNEGTANGLPNCFKLLVMVEKNLEDLDFTWAARLPRNQNGQLQTAPCGWISPLAQSQSFTI